MTKVHDNSTPKITLGACWGTRDHSPFLAKLALIVLNATSGGVSNILFTSIVGAPVGIASASLTLVFSLTTGIIKNYWI